MPEKPAIKIEKPHDVIRRLEKHGFKIIRSKGSYQQLLCTHTEGCHHLVTVALHGSKDVSRRDMTSIIRQTGMSLKEFYGIE